MDTTELKVNRFKSIDTPQSIFLSCHLGQKVADGSQLVLKGALAVSDIYPNEVLNVRVNWVCSIDFFFNYYSPHLSIDFFR